MYASHTLIAYPIISRYGLSRQRTVSITIGGTAVTVVLALMVLAVIGGMYKGEEVGGLFWALLVAKVVLLFGLIGRDEELEGIQHDCTWRTAQSVFHCKRKRGGESSVQDTSRTPPRSYPAEHGGYKDRKGNHKGNEIGRAHV